MRYSSLLALCAFMLCLNTPEVRGEILAVHTYDVMTHTALLPKPVASDNTFSLAATWWLPDWQGSQGSRGSDDIGGGDIVKDDSDCMKHYNLYATCPSPKLSTGVVHPIAGMTCQKSCYCPSQYQYTSSNCSGNYTVSGGSCDGKYNSCVCKSEFRYNSSNCSGEYQVSGSSCGGYYNACTIRPECTVSSKDCTYGCASYNSCSRCISCKSNPDCDVSSRSCTYGCASYNSCSKCTSCKSNPDCSASAVSCSYGCASTNSCGICVSCSGNPDCDVSSLSCSNGCQTYNSCNKCIECKSAPACTSSSSNWCSVHSTCHGNCCTDGTIKSCDTRCGGSGCDTHSHSYSCPSGYSSFNSWGSSALTASKTCSCGATSGTCYKAPAHTHSYSCPSGYSASNSWGSNAVSGNKVCSCGATSGTCYRAPTCKDGGYLTDANGCPVNQIPSSNIFNYKGLRCIYQCCPYWTGEVAEASGTSSYTDICHFSYKVRCYNSIGKIGAGITVTGGKAWGPKNEAQCKALMEADLAEAAATECAEVTGGLSCVFN